jgi:hypothetical protein
MFDPAEPIVDPYRLDRSPAAVRADNLIRQRLRIGDPRDPRAVAEGLKRLFPQDARELDFEASGLPSLPAVYSQAAARTSAESLATGAELTEAVADVERDLQALTLDHRLKDISTELQGWSQAIRTIVADGTAAARLALDPRARDRLFASRRQLGDYARLARFVGALTPTLSASYRKLAQSLDEVSSLLLVLASEALAGAGLGGGRFLLSVPASELQTRRDSVLQALRGLQGVTEASYGNDQWPWGLHGLREVLLRLERSGHLDLRALLDEPVLGRMLDELIERAGQQNVLGMRALGATADVALQRLYRLLHMVDNNVQPASPPVTTFLKAIQLFLDAFVSSRSGYRLLFVGRAPIAFYGLAGIGGPDTATRRLIELVLKRGELAEILDCYLGCDCCGDESICQILLDKLLYDTDRAIDLYTLGIAPEGDGEPEHRAAGYGKLIDSFLSAPAAVPEDQLVFAHTCLQRTCSPATAQKLAVALREISGVLLAPVQTTAVMKLMADELCLQRLSDRRLASVLATLTSNCVPASSALEKLEGMVNAALEELEHDTCTEVEIAPPPTTESSLRIFERLDRQVDRVLDIF